jgi:hypothetical protein
MRSTLCPFQWAIALALAAYLRAFFMLRQKVTQWVAAPRRQTEILPPAPLSALRHWLTQHQLDYYLQRLLR